MLLAEMPGYSQPTIALFPFRWYENGDRWMMRALKIQTNDNLKWGRHYVDDGKGNARADVYDTYESAVAAALAFNVDISRRVQALGYQEDSEVSLSLKVEKEVTSQRRLAQEEQLMHAEAMKRNRTMEKPNCEILILPKGHEYLRGELCEYLYKIPQAKILQLSRRLTLVRSGEVDWSRIAPTTKATGKLCFRESIASGFGLSGADHWGRTKARIRSMLLPRANELLQLASVKKILGEALAKGLRVVVSGGFVFWYEASGGIGWTVKGLGEVSKGEAGDSLWLEGTILSRNHGRIVVLPYVKENGEKVQGHTKNSAHDGPALPRHHDDYLELPFETLDGDLMIGLFGELHYD